MNKQSIGSSVEQKIPADRVIRRVRVQRSGGRSVRWTVASKSNVGFKLLLIHNAPRAWFRVV